MKKIIAIGSGLFALAFATLASAQTSTFTTSDVSSVADPLFAQLKAMLIYIWVNYYPLIIGLGLVAGLVGWIIRKTFRH